MLQIPQISAETRAAARLASGQPIWLLHGRHYYWIVAAEDASPGSLPSAGGQLIITAERAKFLGAEVEGPLAALKLPPRADTLAALINPLKLGQSEMLADFDARALGPHHPAVQAMTLVKHAGLLPAFIMGPQLSAPPLDAVIYETRAPQDYQLSRVSQSALPLRAAPTARVVSFRDQYGATHLAIIIGAPNMDDMPLVRVHSACLTGDILGSLRCDCGDQLQDALKYMQDNGGGILLYLDQEGRGIGLANKLRAYQLQDGGMDTYAANHALGFADDERDFGLAAAMLRELSIHSIRLLTNNPRKVQILQDSGILVKERLPLITTANPHNTAYLGAKASQGGHMMDEQN